MCGTRLQQTQSLSHYSWSLNSNKGPEFILFIPNNRKENTSWTKQYQNKKIEGSEVENKDSIVKGKTLRQKWLYTWIIHLPIESIPTATLWIFHKHFLPKLDFAKEVALFEILHWLWLQLLKHTVLKIHNHWWWRTDYHQGSTNHILFNQKLITD